VKTTDEQINRMLYAICESVVERVRAKGKEGMPAGYLYSELMELGCTLSQFDQIMSALTQLGKVRKAGDLYYAGEE
jgi:hypothetical protein